MRKLLLTIIVPDEYEGTDKDLCISDLFHGNVPGAAEGDFVIESVEEEK